MEVLNICHYSITETFVGKGESSDDKHDESDFSGKQIILNQNFFSDMLEVLVLQIYVLCHLAHT